MYIEIDIDDAVKILRGKNVKVLVSTQDLQNDDVSNFVKKTKKECEEMIRKAETITKQCDEFFNSLNLYSHKQVDIRNIQPVGSVNTILFKQIE